MNKFIVFTSIRGDNTTPVTLSTASIISIAPNERDKSTCYVNTVKYNYLVAYSFEDVNRMLGSLDITKSGEVDNVQNSSSEE